MAAARSVFRSSTVRSAAAQFASAAKTSSTRSSFRSPSATNLLSSRRIFRCPAELSACLESMQPFHTATASALMTSMLAVTCRSSFWAPDGSGGYPDCLLRRYWPLTAAINRIMCPRRELTFVDLYLGEALGSEKSEASSSKSGADKLNGDLLSALENCIWHLSSKVPEYPDCKPEIEGYSNQYPGGEYMKGEDGELHFSMPV